MCNSWLGPETSPETRYWSIVAELLKVLLTKSRILKTDIKPIFAQTFEMLRISSIKGNILCLSASGTDDCLYYETFSVSSTLLPLHPKSGLKYWVVLWAEARRKRGRNRSLLGKHWISPKAPKPAMTKIKDIGTGTFVNRNSFKELTALCDFLDIWSDALC